METDTVTGPAFLASALVNGDTSGLNPEDMECFERFIKRIEPWRVIDVARDNDGEGIEARFTRHFRLHGGNAEGGDVIDYVVHKSELNK